MLNRDQTNQEQTLEERLLQAESQNTPERKRKEDSVFNFEQSKKQKPAQGSYLDHNYLQFMSSDSFEPESKNVNSLEMTIPATSPFEPESKNVNPEPHFNPFNPFTNVGYPLGPYSYQISSSSDASLNSEVTSVFYPEASMDSSSIEQIEDADKKQDPTIVELPSQPTENKTSPTEKSIRACQSDITLSLSQTLAPMAQRAQSESDLSLVKQPTADQNLTATFTTDVIYQYEKVLVEELKYHQLIHIDVPENHPFMNHPGMQPVNDKGEEVNGVATFANALGHHIGGRMSARLFSKDNSMYLLVLRSLFNTPEKDLILEKIRKDLKDDKIFKEFSDGVLIAVIALVRNQGGHIELQLRVIPNADGFGHPGLVFKNEGVDPLCIVVAGEIYILNGEIILVNDKSGNFNIKLKLRNISQKDVFDFLLKSFYAEKYKDNCFWPATADDSVTVYEILQRGFPHSLIRPKKLLESFPLEKLPPDIQSIAIAAENAYQLRKQVKEQEKVKAKAVAPIVETVSENVAEAAAEPAKLIPAPPLADAISPSVSRVTGSFENLFAATDESQSDLTHTSTTAVNQLKKQFSTIKTSQTQTINNLFKTEKEQQPASGTAPTSTNQSSIQNS